MVHPFENFIIYAGHGCFQVRFTSEENEFDEVPPSDEEEESIVAKDRRKKGNWKTIGTAPASWATYPCECRWKLRFPRSVCPKYKQIRWITLPLSDRINQLALPLLRRLLALWLEFADKFSPEMRARLLKFLIENYGLTEEFLERILEEARKANEPPPPKKKGKKKRKRGKRRGRKGKKKRQKEKDDRFEKKKDDSGLGYHRRKAGKLPLDWPYKMGSRLILMCSSCLSQDPDEEYNSRATEYFDVQSMGILEQICKFLDMPLPDPEKPTQCGETLVIMALNLSNWIAKWVVTPAREIPDDKVEEYLDLRGIQPKPKASKKAKGGKGEKKKEKKKAKQEAVQEPPPEDDKNNQKAWEKLKSPTYVPPKIRISKRTALPPEGDENEDEHGTVLEINTYQNEESEDNEEDVARWQKPTLDDIKKEFLEYLIWYNPWEPEFMYLGPKRIPKGVEMFKIWDVDSDEVPPDLRAINWNIVDEGYTQCYSFIPSSVPQYYPSLRPLRPVRLEDVERSGFPDEIIRRDLRFFSPWYIMSKSLTQPESRPPDEEPTVPEELGESEDEGGDVLPETEEHFDDEILQPSGPPPVRDSSWGDYKMREQLEILGHILHLATSVRDLTIEHVFELLEEFCHAVECAESEENPSEENVMHLKKRTIVLERYYFNFFGKKFRDYNERTPYYMRKICSRLAYYIQLLYEYTAKTLWELQSRANRPSFMKTPSEISDDPQALQDWDDWIAWLLRVTSTCDKWAEWISETVDDAEKKAAKRKGEYFGPEGKPERLTKQEWFDWKKSVQGKMHDYRSTKMLYTKESDYYLEKGKTIPSVMHRPIKRWADEPEEKEEAEEDEWENASEPEEEKSHAYVVGATPTVEEENFPETEYEGTSENESF